MSVCIRSPGFWNIPSLLGWCDPQGYSWEFMLVEAFMLRRTYQPGQRRDTSNSGHVAPVLHRRRKIAYMKVLQSDSKAPKRGGFLKESSVHKQEDSRC